MVISETELYDFLKQHQLVSDALFELTPEDQADGYSTVKEKLDGELLKDLSDNYAVIRELGQPGNKELVVFFSEDGISDYVADILKYEMEDDAVIRLVGDLSNGFKDVLTMWRMEPQEKGEFQVATTTKIEASKRASILKMAKGIGKYRRGEVLTDISVVSPGQLLVLDSLKYKAVDLIKVTQTFKDKFYSVFVNPENPVELRSKGDEEFAVYPTDLKQGEYYIALEPSPTSITPEVDDGAGSKTTVAPVPGEEETPVPEQKPELDEESPAPEAKPEKEAVGASKKTADKEPRYIFYFKEGTPVQMWGEGLTKATVDGEEARTVDAALESLISDMSEAFPMVGSLVSLYVGNGTYFTYDMMIDYSIDNIMKDLKENAPETTEADVDKEIDAIDEWLWKNTDVKAEAVVAPEKAEASKKTAENKFKKQYEAAKADIQPLKEKWYQKGADAGANDSWMQPSLDEIKEGTVTDAMEAVQSEEESWESTDPFGIKYNTPLMDDVFDHCEKHGLMIGDRIAFDDGGIDIMYTLKEAFWQGWEEATSVYAKAEEALASKTASKKTAEKKVRIVPSTSIDGLYVAFNDQGWNWTLRKNFSQMGAIQVAEKEALKNQILKVFPDAVFEETTEASKKTAIESPVRTQKDYGELPASAKERQEQISKKMADLERHKTMKKPTDPTFNKEWSGVSGAPHAKGNTCPDCGEKLHIEGDDAFYCPVCDDFKRPREGYASKKTAWTEDGSDITPTAQKVMDINENVWASNGWQDRSAVDMNVLGDALKAIAPEVTADDIEVLTDYNLHAAVECIQNIQKTAAKKTADETPGHVLAPKYDTPAMLDTPTHTSYSRYSEDTKTAATEEEPEEEEEQAPSERYEFKSAFETTKELNEWSEEHGEASDEDIAINEDEYTAYYGGREIAEGIGEFADDKLEDLAKKVHEWMEENQFWPEIISQGERGDISPMVIVKKGAIDNFELEQEIMTSGDYRGSVGSHVSNISSLLANTETLASATQGEGDAGDAYNMDVDRNFTGVNEDLVQATVDEYLTGKATSMASFEDFAGFMEDVYGISKEASIALINAWHTDDDRSIVAFIKTNAKQDLLS